LSQTGGAHRAEGARGHHIDLPGRLHVAVPLHDVDHLFGRHDDGLPLPNLLVDLLKRLADPVFFHATPL
jgi:hypothetical protein